MSLRHALLTIMAVTATAVPLAAVPAEAAAPVVVDDRVGDVRARDLNDRQKQLADVDRATFEVVDRRVRVVVQLVRVVGRARADVVQSSGFGARLSTTYGGMLLSVNGDTTGHTSFEVEASGGLASDSCRGLSLVVRPRVDRLVFSMPIRCLLGSPKLYDLAVRGGVTFRRDDTSLTGTDRISRRQDLPLR